MLYLPAVAGLLAGLAIVVEFSTAIVALTLAGLTLLGPNRLRRVAAYGLGAAVGIVPLLAFNLWAFGSATTLSYTNAVITPGTSGHDVIGANSSGFYGIETPSARSATELLLADKGLLIVCPIVAFAALGLVLAWRRPTRAEAVACATICVLFLLYNASYFLPFGGWGPGPRFLVAALPFSLVLVAYALARFPVAVTVVGLCGVAAMALANATTPIVSEERGLGFWLGRLHAGDVTETVWTRLGVTDRWVAIAPYGVLIVIGLVLAIVAARPFAGAGPQAGLALGAAAGLAPPRDECPGASLRSAGEWSPRRADASGGGRAHARPRRSRRRRGAGCARSRASDRGAPGLRRPLTLVAPRRGRLRDRRCRAPSEPVARATTSGGYSTVTVFARLRGWSTLRPRSRAMR